MRVGSGVPSLSTKRTILECFFLFFNVCSCNHPQNLILKLENTVSQLVILEGGGGEKEEAET